MLASKNFKLDWITIILFLFLVFFGWINIIAASHTGDAIDFFNFSLPYARQFVFILFTIILIILILAIDSKFYERFASIIYILSIISLIGLFIFGKNVNGALSWYNIGGFTIQPSEFAKVATSLAVAKYVSELHTHLHVFKDQILCFIIIAIPMLLVLLQNDTGSALVYISFIFVLFREGLPKAYVIIALSLIVIAVLSLKFGAIITSVSIGILIFVVFALNSKILPFWFCLCFFIGTLLVSFGVSFFYNSVLQAHQKDRIILWLHLEKDPIKLENMKHTFAYNLYESEKAISSGGFWGKGFLDGTRTTGKFVPEQHTDYIFSTVGEEWGFIGTTLVVITFILLLLRILFLAEQQTSQFIRVYGYCVASILFFHFFINIGMVMGLIPTIGIPLPLFSYGGSGLWAFTLLIFIFIKLNASKNA